MPFTLTMPKLSPTMEEGTIAKWHKKEGQYVEAGELLLEIATDKATVEHNALDSGYLRKILLSDGDEAVINQPIAIFTEDPKESIEGYQPEGVKPTAAATAQKIDEKEKALESRESEEPKPAKSGAGLQQPEFTPAPPLENYIFQPPTEALKPRIKASPLARQLAQEKGLDLTTVKGSGPGGRIVKKDLERAQPAGEFTFSRREKPKYTPGSYTEERLSPVRKIISRRLQEAKTFIPHFYITQTIRADALVALRTQLGNLDLKVTFNDFIVRACALALRKFQAVNSSFNSTNQSIVRYQTVDIAIAVSTDNGLITPIIRHADYKNLGEINLEVRALANRAKAGKLEPYEYQGGSFTISNLGMYGITEFQAIINPPQSCILAVGGIEDRAVVEDGRIVPGKTMNISLSVDHRVVDGALGAQFIKAIQHYLENPASLLL